MSEPLDCSVIIRTHGAEKVAQILHMLERQESRLGEIIEVIILDGGTDLTVHGYISAYRCKWKIHLAEYSGKCFTYGSATNQAVSFTSGDIILSLSGHSVPASDCWLDSFLSAFYGSQKVFAVTGGQKAECKVNILEKAYRWFFYGNNISANILRPFNMTNAAIRRDVWEKWKFDEDLSACEDKLWSNLLEREGLRLVIRTEAMVFHAHKQGLVGTIVDLMWLSRYRIYAWVRSYLPD